MNPETLYTLLQHAAAHHGERIAVEFDDQRLTYSEFIDASDRLAGLLTDHGARPGRRVAFCFHKSIDALISLFAIIRTGATYVPLDPGWPAARMATICNDADIRFWIGSDPPPEGIECIENVFVSDPRASDATPLASWQDRTPQTGMPAVPENGIANILYTSGSTGRPKGVRITTRGLLHFSKWVADYFELTPDDRLANHAPYNFDLSTLDIFAAVRAGATMCPVPERLKMFPYQMAKFIADQRITVWYSVPSALIMIQLRGRLTDHDLSRLRHVIFAGEVMPKPALQAIAGQLPHSAWTNLFGPTETNVCTYFRIDAAELRKSSPVPIGGAISDTRLWIVNEDGNPIPEGEAGELWVGGPAVTTGYHSDDDLTAKKLIPAPDGDGLAYRTGDRVRRRNDGVLMFEGRIDRMIKCRGHRIEPGEIEAALHQHPAVREVAVVPVPDPVFGNRIKACVVMREGASPDESALAVFCRDHLPAYMLPDLWEFHTDLPRTKRDKVDLQALLNSQ